MKKQKMAASVAGLLLSSCAAMAVAQGEVNAAYQWAVMDAAFAGAGEVATDLTIIDKSNTNLIWNEDGTRVLVATWKAAGSYEKFLKPYTATSDNPDYAVWVTAAPQVQNFCRHFMQTNPGAGQAEVELRLRQALGLDPSWTYDVFVEMWVDPADMFRPCVDPEVTDATCGLQFGDTAPQVTNIPDYASFYRNLYYKSFRGSAGVPWTGLGYTYDWGNADTEEGASEFILRPGTPYEIKQAVPTMQYCTQQESAS